MKVLESHKLLASTTYVNLWLKEAEKLDLQVEQTMGDYNCNKHTKEVDKFPVFEFRKKNSNSETISLCLSSKGRLVTSILGIGGEADRPLNSEFTEKDYIREVALDTLDMLNPAVV